MIIIIIVIIIIAIITIIMIATTTTTNKLISIIKKNAVNLKPPDIKHPNFSSADYCHIL